MSANIKSGHHSRDHTRSGGDLRIGIDAGGSKTAAAIVRCAADQKSNLEILGRGVAGPCSITSTSPDEWGAALSKAIDGALQKADLDPATPFHRVTAAVAGYSNTDLHQPLLKRLEAVVPATEYRLAPDYAAALAGAAAGEPGVVVIAGTGSVVYGADPEGRHICAGGLGYLLGDDGSGFWLGQQAIRLALSDRLEDGPLRHRLFDILGTLIPSEIIAWCYRPDETGRVTRIAQLAKAIASAAYDGDEVALQLMLCAAEHLAHRVLYILRWLSFNQPVKIYRIGGLWRAGKPLVVPFIGTIKAAFPGAEFPENRYDPEIGAALLDWEPQRIHRVG
ncbi:MAG: hypothetical protein M1330_05465 [Armatimonadetes bacterium]|nr:hypothetical protein [Armatimonadota bacterium]